MKTLGMQPRLTEKTYGVASNKAQVYVFDVAPSANTLSIKRAVESQFEVTVTKVNLLNKKGKAKRTIAKKGRKTYAGSENVVKKAYVTLKSGDSLPFFQSIEEEEAKQEKVQEKMEKAFEKQDAKEAKTESKRKSGRRTEEKPAEQPEKPAEKPRGFLRLGGRRGKKESK